MYLESKNGQVVFLGLMLVVVIIILALSFAPTLKILTETAMNTENLDCDNSSISNFDKLGCLGVDIGTSYFIIGLIFIAGLIITARIIIE